MALLQNTTILAQSPTRFLGGPAPSSERSAWGRNRRNWFAGVHDPESRSGFPDGNLAPGSIVMPQVAGGMASRRGIKGQGGMTGDVAGGINATADLVGAGDITSASASMIVSMVAAITGAGTLTTANISALATAAASLTGSGDITSAVRSALANAEATLAGGGTVTSAVVTALGSLSADIRVTGDLLTTANVGSAVWSYVVDGAITAEQALQILMDALSGGVPTEAEIASAVRSNLAVELARVDVAVSTRESKANARSKQTVINEGVQKASLVIPHTEDLPADV